MDKGEFMEGIHILQNNYNKKLSTEQLKLFYENLKDMSRDRFLSNIGQVIETNPFMPNIAQLRNETAKNYANYEQREYSDTDFSKYYANQRRVNK